MQNVTHTVNHFFVLLSVCRNRLSQEVQGLAIKQDDMSLFTWILSGSLDGGPLSVRTLRVIHTVLNQSYKPSIDYSTRSLFFVFFCPQLLCWPFFSLSCCLTHTLPLGPIHQAAMFLFCCVSLLSWWASQETVHAFEGRNLLLLSLAFPFQFPRSQLEPRHSACRWAGIDVFLKRLVKQEMDGKKWRQWDAWARRMIVMKQSSSCCQREVIQFNFIVIHLHTIAQRTMECFVGCNIFSTRTTANQRENAVCQSTDSNSIVLVS